MTKPKKTRPALPSKGGAYTVQKDGALARDLETASAPAAPKKKEG